MFYADRSEFVPYDTLQTLHLLVLLPLYKKAICVLTLDRKRSDGTMIRLGRLQMHLADELKLATIY